MADKRPLIFMTPYNETVKKLQEVAAQSAEVDKIEIFEIDSVPELAKLLALHGPSLIIYNHPKKCALGLQANQKILRRLQAKTVLITDKVIPRKTLDKFMKLGLTDCIVEPISPKSLLYKIKLLIKALPNLNDKEEDYRTITGEAAEKKGEDLSLKEKSANEKVSKQDKLIGEINGEENKPIAPAVPEGEKKKADVIEKNYKGKIKEKIEAEEKDEENKDDNKKSNATIDTHYKGKRKKDLELLDDDNQLEGGSSDKEEDNSEELTSSFKLNVEDDGDNNSDEDLYGQNESDDSKEKKKKSLGLDVEEDKESKGDLEEGDGTKIDKYLKSKNKTNSLNVEDDSELDFTEKSEDEDTSPMVGKTKSKNLEVEDEGDDYLQKLKDDKKADKKRKEQETGLSIENDGKDHEQELEKEKDIDKYLRSNNAKKNLEVDDDGGLYKDEQDEEESKKDSSDIGPYKLNVKDDGSPTQDGEDEEQDSDANKNAKGGAKKPLNPKDDETDDSPELTEDGDNDKSPLLKTKKLLNKNNLKLEEEEGPEPENDNDEEDKKFNSVNKKNGLNVDDDEGLLNQKADEQEDKDPKKKKLNALQVEKDKKAREQGPVKKVDHIETYYGRKKKEKEDPDWDEIKKSEKAEQQDFGPKEKYEKSLIIDKEDLGEQTIDYKQLKDEFEELGGGYADSVKSRYTISESAQSASSPISGGNTPGGVVLTPDGQLVTTTTNEQGEQVQEVIYYPNSKGIEFAIRALQLYYKKDSSEQEILTYLGKTMVSQFNGRATFMGIEKKSGVMKELLSCHQLFLPEGQAVENESETSSQSEAASVVDEVTWNAYKTKHLASWLATRLPKWSDETFQAQNQTYIFPYYEGTAFLGLCIIDFTGIFDATKAPMIEVLCESARGIFLYNYHYTGKRGQYTGQPSKENENNEQKGALGFLKGFFGKKAS